MSCFNSVLKSAVYTVLIALVSGCADNKVFTPNPEEAFQYSLTSEDIALGDGENGAPSVHPPYMEDEMAYTEPAELVENEVTSAIGRERRESGALMTGVTSGGFLHAQSAFSSILRNETNYAQGFANSPANFGKSIEDVFSSGVSGWYLGQRFQFNLEANLWGRMRSFAGKKCVMPITFLKLPKPLKKETVYLGENNGKPSLRTTFVITVQPFVAEATGEVFDGTGSFTIVIDKKVFSSSYFDDQEQAMISAYLQGRGRDMSNLNMNNVWDQKLAGEAQRYASQNLSYGKASHYSHVTINGTCN